MDLYTLNCIPPLGTLPLDENVAHWFRAHLTPTLSSILQTISMAGSEIFIALLVIATILFLLLTRRWQRLFTFLLMAPCGMLLGECLKLWTQRPRPFPGDPLAGISEWGGYSFPSGHTLSATLMFGFLLVMMLPALTQWRWRAFWTLAGLGIIGAVGFSRVALGAHYLTDVIGALAFGIAWISVTVSVMYLIRRQLRRAPQTLEIQD